jgi:broad specificity phosphatase PhoE
MLLLLAQPATGETVLVGHDSVNRVLLLLALDLPLSRYWLPRQDPCAVSFLEPDRSGAWRCGGMNQVAHLRSVVVASALGMLIE